MGSSKLIAKWELFQVVLLMHQSCVFWLLPCFLLQGNGTAGLLALLPGLLAGVVLLFVCAFWSLRCPEQPLAQLLPVMLWKPLGWLAGVLLLVLCAVPAMIGLYGLTEMLHAQILPETPRLLLFGTFFVLAGWFSWNGLEDMARFAVFGVVVLLLLLLLLLAGSWQLFSWENLLPLRVQAPQAMQMAMLQNGFAVGGLLVIFLVYPARNTGKPLVWPMLLALVASFVYLLVWLALILGVFGQHGAAAMVWPTVELARMVQVGPFLERTEAIFAVLWMLVAFESSGLLFWCISESTHQLLQRQKNSWLHWGVLLFLLVPCFYLTDMERLLVLGQRVAPWYCGALAVLLILIVVGTWRYCRRKEA